MVEFRIALESFMTKAIFHPSQRLLVELAAGALPLGPGLTVRAHADGCPSCRAIIEAREELEGRRLAETPDAPLRPGALAVALSRIADSTASTTPHGLGDTRIPQALADVTFAERRFLNPDTWVAHVIAPETDGWLTYLLHAPAGAQFPSHDHSGPEFICLLEGDYSDTRQHMAGDFADNGPGFEHVMAISPAGPCLCLISTLGPIPWRRANRALGTILGV
jgi:putative transcriptional regulator